ncbi:MAG: ABC transporter ATP-binding protein [Pseudomonadota bacterium]
MPTKINKAANPVKLGDLLAPIKPRLILGCSFQAVAAAAGIVPFIAVAELGRAFFRGTPPDPANIWWIAGIAIAALMLRLICQVAALALTHLADLDLQLNLRRQMAAHLMRVPLGWFDARSAGQVKKALQDDIVAMHHLVGHAFTDTVSAAIAPVVALGYLIWLDWRLALIAIIPMFLGATMYALQFARFGNQVDAYNRSLNRVNEAAVEYVQGIAVIKTFGGTKRAFDRFTERAERFSEDFWDMVRGMLLLAVAADLVLSPIFAIAFVLIAAMLVGLGPAETLAIVVLAPGMTAPLLNIAFAQNEFMLARNAARRIGGLLATPPLPDTADPKSPDGHRVSYNGVAFSYDGQTNALQDINLVMEPGKVTALVGPSGSGKSTLACLLPRFWDVSKGEICIGGVSVRDMVPGDLYSKVGYVFQNVQLLRTSIAENISLGRPDATHAEIVSAAQAAGIHNRIENLPRGYESVAGIDAHLSGGEAQRVTIARALMADAPIVVLDEATAFADPDSEAEIQSAVSQLIVGRTLLVIAHRLHTITGADQICVLDGGRIVERGRHEELLIKNGLYARMWHAHQTARGAGAA